MAKPMLFDQTVADAICEKLVEGISLRRITKDEDMPSASTVFKWLRDNPDFAEQYASAREAQADTLADEIVDIADGRKAVEQGNDPDPARDRLAVDARKWVAGKLKPKKYGDKTLLGSDPENPLPAGFDVRLIPGPDDSPTS